MTIPGDIIAATSGSERATHGQILYGANLPTSDLNLLNGVDLLVMIVGPDGKRQMDKLRATSAYQNLSAVSKGHVIELGPDLAAAIYYSSPNSIPWALKQISPQLTDALAGRARKQAAQSSSGGSSAPGIDYTPNGKPSPSPSP
jgi:ABC-type Fe3+-hydroxamate transport system substrate-binding protein